MSTAEKTLLYEYTPPSPMEDLTTERAWLWEWLKDPSMGTAARDRCHRWCAEATALLESISRLPSAGTKLPPYNCTVCNHRNEYVGLEHLSTSGTYTCRSCKGRA